MGTNCSLVQVGADTIFVSLFILGLVNVYYDDIGIVDFYPAEDAIVLYASENDILSGGDYRRKIVQLSRNVCTDFSFLFLDSIFNIVI